MTGIVPLRSSNHVLLFSAQGQFGDGWREDGFFYYSGTSVTTGSRDPSNRIVETSWESGRRLQLLLTPGRRAQGTWRYAGSFVFDGVAEERTMPGRNGSDLRYPLYRLRTVDDLTHRPGRLPPPGDHRTVDIRRVERSDLLCRDALADPMHGERPETRLSKSFERYLMGQGYAVHRARIRHSPQCAPMLTDTWVAQLRLLIEAKAGKNPTDDVRYAVGQLGQYTRHLPGVLRKAILLPRDSGEELRAFARHMGADLIWPDGESWWTTGDWARDAGIDHFVEPGRAVH
ncbi:hypothetical protein [Streptomyces bobili]|uniref:hypothetical protein n=1 Tax=Streptomyces bobili TaxID=67280 RepID=UPI0037ABEB90